MKQPRCTCTAHLGREATGVTEPPKPAPRGREPGTVRCRGDPARHQPMSPAWGHHPGSRTLAHQWHRHRRRFQLRRAGPGTAITLTTLARPRAAGTRRGYRSVAEGGHGARPFCGVTRAERGDTWGTAGLRGRGGGGRGGIGMGGASAAPRGTGARARRRRLDRRGREPRPARAPARYLVVHGGGARGARAETAPPDPQRRAQRAQPPRHHPRRARARADRARPRGKGAGPCSAFPPPHPHGRRRHVCSWQRAPRRMREAAAPSLPGAARLPPSWPR